MKTYKSLLIDEDTYNRLKRIKEGLKEEGKKETFDSIIKNSISNQYFSVLLDKNIREYINAFVEEAKKINNVLGIAIFGSVSRNDYTKYSDIDLFIVVDKKDTKTMAEIHSIHSKLHEEEDKMTDRGLYLYISPLIMERDRLKTFRPIYIDIARDGIILFEKNFILSDFFSSINSIKTSTKIIEGVKVIKWKTE